MNCIIIHPLSVPRFLPIERSIYPLVFNHSINVWILGRISGNSSPLVFSMHTTLNNFECSPDAEYCRLRG